jgi:hypothetical protein
VNILQSGALNVVFIRVLYLAHFFFISFIDDVSGVIHFCRFHIYADDLQIYHSFSVADLWRCYDEVNGLKLNPNKSQEIFIQKGVVMGCSLSSSFTVGTCGLWKITFLTNFKKKPRTNIFPSIPKCYSSIIFKVNNVSSYSYLELYVLSI